MNKPKILYISSVTPNTSCGSNIAIFRHLVKKDNFNVAVCSYSAEKSETTEKFKIKFSQIRQRIQNTRFSRLIWNIHYIFSWCFLPKSLFEYSNNYKPDLILTVPDNIHSGFAYQLSKKLNIPLAVNFQDLFPISQFSGEFTKPYPWTRKFLIKKFHFLNKKSNLAFYTSEGMQDYFGTHNNGFVLYPIGDFNRPEIGSNVTNSLKKESQPFTIVYAGNCYGAYGRMLIKLVREIVEIQNPNIKLEIFPAGIDWTPEEIDFAKNNGILQSFLPFEELRLKLSNADAFLTVMGFEVSEKPFVQTSFTTKWLDYAPYKKPIFVWAPHYSSASIFAEKYNCGIVIKNDNPSCLVKKFTEILTNKELAMTFSRNARSVSDKILNPDNIHDLFVKEINNLIYKNMDSTNETS